MIPTTDPTKHKAYDAACQARLSLLELSSLLAKVADTETIYGRSRRLREAADMADAAVVQEDWITRHADWCES